MVGTSNQSVPEMAIEPWFRHPLFFLRVHGTFWCRRQPTTASWTLWKNHFSPTSPAPRGSSGSHQRFRRCERLRGLSWCPSRRWKRWKNARTLYKLQLYDHDDGGWSRRFKYTSVHRFHQTPSFNEFISVAHNPKNNTCSGSQRKMFRLQQCSIILLLHLYMCIVCGCVAFVFVLFF